MVRNVARTAPYFHDGSVATLRDAVVSEIYREPDSTLPVALSHEELDGIVRFLESLTTIPDVQPSAEFPRLK
ncbi:MAG: hypothetical protein KIT73_16200 [Burkholderiales bacterium]|nr:hypothetical protein [Burkholderiales bacterium]